MQEIIFNSHTYEVLFADAERLGFTTTDADGNVIILTDGTFQSGGGWFLNVVGTVYEPVTPPLNPDDPWPEPVAREGYWGRLRINGDPSSMPAFDPQIVQYFYYPDRNMWSSDGVTPAPAWVGLIGEIA